MFIMFINICCCYCSIYNINWLFFLLKSKLLLIIKHFCLFLISFLLNSIPCCRIAISDFVFSCKNFSVSESVLLRFDVDCFSSFSIDFCFIVPPKVSNDFLRMSFFFLLRLPLLFFFCFSLGSWCIFWATSNRCIISAKVMSLLDWSHFTCPLPVFVFYMSFLKSDNCHCVKSVKIRSFF